MKILRMAAVGAVAALALTACSSNNSSGTANTSAPAGGATSAAPAAGNIRVWLVGTDTPQDARDYLKKTFESENPGSTLTIEQQSWTGLVDKYTTALSGSDSPDLVEIGNTQATTFTAVGAFLDLTDKFDELGGKDLLPGFVEAGSYDGKFYAAPYYSGARIVLYSKAITKDTAVPTTWDQYLANAKSLTTDKVSGLYAPGKDWHDFVTFVWANGGDIATQDSSGKWTAGFESDAAIKGLQQFQDIAKNANHAPADATETDEQVPFCAGSIAYVQAPSWLSGSIAAAENAQAPGCGSTLGSKANLAAFAIPGATAGTYAPVLAGGSNLAIPAKSAHPELAYKALQITLSDGYQKLLAANGMVPAKVSQAKFLPADVFSQAAASAAANAKLTPASPNWANVEASGVLEDAFSKIAQGQDVKTVAADLDAKIDAALNAQS